MPAADPWQKAAECARAIEYVRRRSVAHISRRRPVAHVSGRDIVEPPTKKSSERSLSDRLIGSDNLKRVDITHSSAPCRASPQ
jgi:hypothetical protein